MAGLKVTADNAAIISSQLAEITEKINNGNGTLWKLIQDSTMANNISQMIVSLRKGSKGLNENMNAAKDNFLLRGYFKKKEKAAQKVKDDAIEKKADEQKVIVKEEKEAQKEKDKALEKKMDEQKVLQMEEKAAQKEKDKALEKKMDEQKVLQMEEKTAQKEKDKALEKKIDEQKAKDKEEK
jgi:phospholipid/cholesterol/gamma-HCH transport system substrate-binding protein